MPLFKCVLLFAVFCIGSFGHAQAVRSAPKIRFGTSVGVGYIQWNEKMVLNQGSVSETGFAAYSGPAINTDINWNGSWWMLGTHLAAAAGKAASGGTRNLEFTDGTNRSWYGFVINPYALYRIKSRFLLGGGYISRLTWVDWEPSDQTLKIEAQSGIQGAPSLQLRYRISSKLEFVNSFGFFGPTETQWILSANWNL
ncbi:hypothetical protein AZI86_17035 [Bdellovibrio bacteriovorus]|uniref:Outer membrane protein beta-barrel domain-containing protein n=1 Tax=Bdellovibrio bacteriovorus TaxID=959 RepID=A0A150WE74_BDEBC|nr:hypothetical protein [Bdellovibrio bacteriovorus]KYG61418.1 hypothetical protein AZI86_17035 [Bdellovibrio bacteriovorus]